MPGEAGSFGPGRFEVVAERGMGVDVELVEASADRGELEPEADLVAEMGGGGGEANAAVLSASGVNGGERLDGSDDNRDHAVGGGEAEGFVGEVLGTGVVAVGDGEDCFELGVESTTDEADTVGTCLIADRTCGVDVVAPQGEVCCTDGHRRRAAGKSSCVSGERRARRHGRGRRAMRRRRRGGTARRQCRRRVRLHPVGG